MKFNIMATTDADLRLLAECDWPSLPRIGETITLEGKMFGSAFGAKHGEDETSEFLVKDVFWGAGVNNDGTSTGPLIEVVVTHLPVNVPSLQFRCTCDTPKPSKNQAARCENCDDLISTRRPTAHST